MTLVEKERLCQRELDELRRLIDLDVSSYPADVEAALRFLHAHLFEESLNASRVQRQEGLRSHNLPARFKRYFGLGLRDYIEDRRIMAAMRLLWHEEVEIYLVAAAVGYAHHETFTRAFKRRVGCTPSQFRAHFAHAARAAEPGNEPSSPPAKPLRPAEPPCPDEPPSPTTPQPREVLMFITDVVGMRTADETHDLRVSGTATGVAEIYVNAAASGESRSQVAEVGPDGRWVALFSAEDDVFACGRPLLVEAGSEGRTQIRWEGPLDCAEVVPRRQRAEKEAATEDAEPDERTATRAHGGGNYTGDAAMTVTVATGRGPAPPPLTDPEKGAAPYYERRRAKPSAQEPPRAKRPEDAPPEAEPPDEPTSDESHRDLRGEVAALRSQIDALVQTLEGRSQRAEEESQREPAVREEASDEGGGASSDEPSSESSDALRTEIEALRRELRERGQTREARTADQTDRTEKADRDDASGDAVEDGETTDEPPAWRQEIHDLREQVEALRAQTETRGEQETEDSEVSDAGEGNESEEASEPEWKRAIASLREQVEDLRGAESPPESGSEDHEPADESVSDGSDVEEHEGVEEREGAVSPRENRADLYEAITALRERIAQLERADETSGTSGGEDPDGDAAEARSPRPVRREGRADGPREEAPEERGPGVLARQRIEDRDLRPGQSSTRGRDTPSPRSRPSAAREGRQRDDRGRAEAPIIEFEPFEVGDWTDDGQREVRVRARITHPSREPVAAELSDDRDDRVLADGRSERGALTLDEWVEMEPGKATFTVTVTEPSPARMSTVWTLDEPDARGEKGVAVEEGQPEEDEPGWVSRAVGGAWGLTVALFLLSLAAGVHGFLRGLVAAGFLGFFGSYLALTIPRRWGVWTAAGIGLFALALVTLLPFTPIVQMDSYLLIAGLATLGLVAAAIVALFVSSD